MWCVVFWGDGVIWSVCVGSLCHHLDRRCLCLCTFISGDPEGSAFLDRCGTGMLIVPLFCGVSVCRWFTHSIKLTTMRLKDQRQSYATWATSMARWLNQAIPVLTTSLALVSHWAPLITSIFPSVPGDVAAPLLLLLTAAWNWLKWQLARYSNSVMSALQRVYLQFNFRDCLIWQVMSEHNWKSDFKTLLFLSQHSIMLKLTIDAQGQAGIIVSSVQGTCSWHSPTSGCLYFESIILPSQQSSNTWTNISKFCNITSILIIFPASVPLKSLE